LIGGKEVSVLQFWILPIGCIASGVIWFLAVKRSTLIVSWAPLAAGIAVAALIWSASAPSTEPFAAGHDLGWGALLGALAAGVGYTVAGSVSDQRRGGSHASGLPALVLGVIACWGVYAVSLQSVVGGLLGVLIGWLSVALILLAKENADGTSSQYSPIIHSSLLMSLLCVLLCLISYRTKVQLRPGAYELAALAMATAFLLTTALFYLHQPPDRKTTWPAGLRPALTTCFAFLVGAISLWSEALQGDVIKARSSLTAAMVAAAIGGLILGYFLVSRRADGTVVDRIFAAMLGVALLIPGLHAMVGTGGGFCALLAMVAVISWQESVYREWGSKTARVSPVSARLTAVALVPGLSVLIMRLLSARFDLASNYPGVKDHFQLVALFLTCLTLWLLGSVLRHASFRTRVGVMAVAGLLPVALVVVWGGGVVQAVLVGIVVSLFLARENPHEVHWLPVLCLASLTGLLSLTSFGLHAGEYARWVRAVIGALPVAAATMLALRYGGNGEIRVSER